MAGLSKPTVSTGKPMNKLHGAAKYTAELSNIGGGLKTTGGKVHRWWIGHRDKECSGTNSKGNYEQKKQKKLGSKYYSLCQL